MSTKRLLLLSNSTLAGQPYLSYAIPTIHAFLGKEVKQVLFIPYAAVCFSYDEYLQKVAQQFNPLGYQVLSIHQCPNPQEAVRQAEAIVVGGGNTWQLLKRVQEEGLLALIKNKVEQGTPYIGWSAGSNLACPTLSTTNDMPIIAPASFTALQLVPFQINPHFTQAHPEGFGGETREDRIAEFTTLHPQMPVVGLREGSILHCEDQKLHLLGKHSARIFLGKQAPYEVQPQDDLSFLLE